MVRGTGSVVLEDCSFHEKTNLTEFDRDRTLSIGAQDGEVRREGEGGKEGEGKRGKEGEREGREGGRGGGEYPTIVKYYSIYTTVYVRHDSLIIELKSNSVKGRRTSSCGSWCLLFSVSLLVHCYEVSGCCQ